MRIAVIVGTRPEIIKMGPVVRALQRAGADFRIVHTGQHYDANMSGSFLADLGYPEVDAFLGIGSGSQAKQTANAMVAIEEDLLLSGCDTVLVQGDTNTVLAGALVGVKCGMRVGHVEAGLRSYDRRMPEEYNRIVADHVSSLLFAPTEPCARTLREEKVHGEIHLTGNTAIDAVNEHALEADRRATVSLPSEPYALATAHRAENVDDPRVLSEFVEAFTTIPLHVVYPIHPRTVKMLKQHGLDERLKAAGNVTLLPPATYFDMLHLMRRARVILTDSGGIQEEATAAAIRRPVLVLRTSTERPEAVDAGFARVVGTRSKDIVSAVLQELDSPARLPERSPYGDGRAGARIAALTLGQGA